MDSIQSVSRLGALQKATPFVFTIRTEVVLYGMVTLLALILRVAQLDVVPLNSYEARQALAAWRVVYPQAAGSPIVPESPLAFALHYFSFSVLGANEFSARILTALGSIALVLSPILFTALFGRLRTFLMVMLLAFSPIMLTVGRMDSPVVWTMLLVVIGLWGLWQSYMKHSARTAMLTVLCIGAAIFVSDPTGLFVVASVLLALVFLLWYKRSSLALEPAIPSASPAEHLGTWPWSQAFVVTGLVIFIVATVFMVYPAGISSVGELLASGLRGLSVSRSDLPPFFSVLTTLYYEPMLVILGLVAAFWVVTGDRVGWEDRFLLGWLIFSAGLSFLYAGTGPEHALWLVIPLAALASRVVTNLVAGGDDLFGQSRQRWLAAVVMAALLAMISVHAQSIARSLMTSPGSELQQVNLNPQNLIGIIIAALLILIGYFMATSEWGEAVTVRGGVLGVVIFMMVTSLASGWHISVNNSENAVEFWNRNATSNQTIQLRQTLLELSDRETAGFPEITVHALVPDDGVVAWVLRDFPNAQFISDVNAAKGQGVVLLPATDPQPDLGGAYVGSTVNITNNWDFRTLSAFSVPAWWLQRRTLVADLPKDSLILWLRQDIYNGTQPLSTE